MICGKAFVGEDRVCGEACKASKRAEVKTKLRKYLVIEVVLVVVTVVILFAAGVF